MDKNMISLIFELERIIGNETYNPNSYDGYTMEEGRDFRYPVKYDGDGTVYKMRGTISLQSDGVDKNTVNTMRYEFGSNHLYIGRGIRKVLKYLEDRYGIDFSEMEHKYMEEELNDVLESDDCEDLPFV